MFLDSRFQDLQIPRFSDTAAGAPTAPGTAAARRTLRSQSDPSPKVTGDQMRREEPRAVAATNFYLVESSVIFKYGRLSFMIFRFLDRWSLFMSFSSGQMVLGNDLGASGLFQSECEFILRHMDQLHINVHFVLQCSSVLSGEPAGSSQRAGRGRHARGRRRWAGAGALTLQRSLFNNTAF